MSEDSNINYPAAASNAEEQDVFTDADLAMLKARLQADPTAARAFALVQKQGFETLRRLAQETMARLAAMEPSPKAVDAGTDWRRFSGLARDRETAARERRLLAQDLVIGALVNVDNPAWDPFNPSTSKHSSDSTLLALLNPALVTPQSNGPR